MSESRPPLCLLWLRPSSNVIHRLPTLITISLLACTISACYVSHLPKPSDLWIFWSRVKRSNVTTHLVVGSSISLTALFIMLSITNIPFLSPKTTKCTILYKYSVIKDTYIRTITLSPWCEKKVTLWGGARENFLLRRTKIKRCSSQHDQWYDT